MIYEAYCILLEEYLFKYGSQHCPGGPVEPVCMDVHGRQKKKLF
jgi:hypothetical protein